MLLMMIEKQIPIDLILFCDTGLEFPAMYDHLGGTIITTKLQAGQTVRNFGVLPVNPPKPSAARWGFFKLHSVHLLLGLVMCKNIYDLGYGTPCAFQSLYENNELFAEIFRHFPYPMHICAPDGTMLLANDAYLRFAKISNPEKLYKKHNILLNPNLERWGVKDLVVRAFKGEATRMYDVKVPHQEIIERLGDDKEPDTGDAAVCSVVALSVSSVSLALLLIVMRRKRQGCQGN
jgi:hypothetical protein